MFAVNYFYARENLKWKLQVFSFGFWGEVECVTRCRLMGHNENLLQLWFFFIFPLQGSCQFIKCSNGKTCIEDQNSNPQCSSCPRCSNGSRNLTHQVIAKMVCGTDGVTYRSRCELQQKSCKLGKSISVLHKGPCIGESH